MRLYNKNLEARLHEGKTAEDVETERAARELLAQDEALRRNKEEERKKRDDHNTSKDFETLYIAKTKEN